MEPAALGKPIVCGPRMGDFRESFEALRDSGALEAAPDSAALTRVLGALVADPAERARRGAAARATVIAHQGATERTSEALLAMLAEGAPSHA
jgi:3-deoxy-D-manno-octulosonic-acid transferase